MLALKIEFSLLLMQLTICFTFTDIYFSYNFVQFSRTMKQRENDKTFIKSFPWAMICVQNNMHNVQNMHNISTYKIFTIDRCSCEIDICRKKLLSQRWLFCARQFMQRHSRIETVESVKRPCAYKLHKIN